MLLPIPNIFSKAEAKILHDKIENALWVDGNITSGEQAAKAKKNKQLPIENPVCVEIGNIILDALGQNQTFISAALPLKILPPLFNRYDIGDGFDIHIDNAIRPIKGTPHRIRTDLSITLFLTEPEDYDGGELVIETPFGAQEVKLEAGSIILYPSSSLHKVNEITRGSRISSFFWLQSMIRSDNQRAILFDLDQTIQTLTMIHGNKNPEIIRLSGVYHNLIREWADA